MLHVATLLFIATGHHVVDTWDEQITEYWIVHMQSGKVRAPTLIFQKPAPLAPKGRAQLRSDGRYYIKHNGRWRLTKGVPQNQSIYYWWWCFLRQSWKYQLACGQQVKLNARQEREYKQWWKSVGQQIHTDFGDIFSTDFHLWWTNRERTKRGRGAELFGVLIRPDLPDQFADWNTLESYQNQIEADHIRVVMIPRTLTKKTLRSKLSRLISSLETDWQQVQQPRYSVHNSKVRSETLHQAHEAWHGRLAGLSNIEIAAQLKYPKALVKELALDGRTSGFSDRLLEPVEQKKLNKLLGTGQKRTRMKNVLNVQAARLICMAEANISAAEQGSFPVSLNEALSFVKRR